MNFLLQQRKREINDSLKPETSLEAGRRGGNEAAHYVSLFSSSYQFIIYCWGEFLLSILYCSFPSPLPCFWDLERRIAYTHKSQAPNSIFTARGGVQGVVRGGRKKEKENYTGKQMSKGFPGGEWFPPEGSKIRNARGQLALVVASAASTGRRSSN